MRKNEVIKKLEDIPGNPVVCITNWAENLADDRGDGSGAGIYGSFDIALHENAAEEIKPGDEHFIGLSFDDASRDENGNLIDVINDDEFDEVYDALVTAVELLEVNGVKSSFRNVIDKYKIR